MTFTFSPIKWAHHQHTRLITLCGIVLLLVFVYTTSQIDEQDPESGTPSPASTPALKNSAHRRQSLYTPSMFIPDALLHNNFRPISAVVLRTSPDDDTIRTLIDHLHKYPFIKEITIYNLVTPLSTQAFERPNTWRLHKVDINIIQGDLSDGIMALFSTCALSNYGHCYLQVDQSMLNLHMDTLYTHFLQTPDGIHVNVRSEEYLTHRRWQLTFQDGGVDLHTGYANLRYGAIIPRSQAQLFINQVAVLKPSQLRHADVLFSFWMNAYPYMLSNPYPLPSESTPPFESMLKAVQDLKAALAHHTPYFVQNEIDQPRDVRTACENDKCLFVTNIDPFPVSTPYEPHQNLTNASLGSPLAWQHELDLDIPGQEYWTHRGYHAAVDGDSGTCWNTYLAPKEGDYVGLNLIGSMRASRLLVYLRHRHPEPLFKVRALSLKQQIWMDCTLQLDSAHSLPRRRVFTMICPDPIITAIRLFFVQQHPRSFDLCGLGIDNFIV